MNKYRVTCSELVFYEVEVEAESEQDAMEIVSFSDENLNLGEPVDGENFEVIGAELVQDEQL